MFSGPFDYDPAHLLALRLAYLQVYRHEDLAEQAENNRTTLVPVVPNRAMDTRLGIRL